MTTRPYFGMFELLDKRNGGPENVLISSPLFSCAHNKKASQQPVSARRERYTTEFSLQCFGAIPHVTEEDSSKNFYCARYFGKY